MTVRILKGDCREVLRTLPDESVHCVVTSPPYWGLRDYGVTSQLGLETSLGEHVENMVGVFREVRRVLRKDGTLWLNYGDSYATAPNGRKAADIVNDDRTFRDKPFSTIGPVYNVDSRNGGFRGKNAGRTEIDVDLVPKGRIEAGGYLKPKDLCGIPWRVAFALQNDGWYLRSDIIWSKPNPMPESVTDRPTKAHEYLFLMSKSERYYYDAEAIREPQAEGTFARFGMDGVRTGSGIKQTESPNGFIRDKAGYNKAILDGGRNRRTVWEIPTSPFPEAHFATFPPALVEPCIKAGTSEKGCCAKCGAPWVREVERYAQNHISRPDRQIATGGVICGGVGKNFPDVTLKTVGWSPSCSCAEFVCQKGCTVLDILHGDKHNKDSRLRESLHPMRHEISGAERNEQVVLPGMPSSVGCQESSNNDRQNDFQQGLCIDSQTGSSNGGGGRLCDGAQAGNGENLGTLFDQGRSGASHKRNQSRQPPGKSRIDDEAATRQKQKADVSRDLPPLSKDVSPSGECPCCGGRFVQRPFPTVPATVLDCFGGAGTTGLVADRLGRNTILIELNPEYAQMAERRITGDCPMFAEVSA